MEETGCVNMKFIVFLKTTLGKMVATKTLAADFINLEFWQKWPRKFYNVKCYDSTKEQFEKDAAALNNPYHFDDDDDDNDEGNQEEQIQIPETQLPDHQEHDSMESTSILNNSYVNMEKKKIKCL